MGDTAESILNKIPTASPVETRALAGKRLVELSTVMGPVVYHIDYATADAVAQAYSNAGDGEASGKWRQLSKLLRQLETPSTAKR